VGVARFVAPGAEAGVAAGLARPDVRVGRRAVAFVGGVAAGLARGLAAAWAVGAVIWSGGVGAARLSLLRCGRVRGRPPRTSEGLFSLMPAE
jgi:hypothetical protein